MDFNGSRQWTGTLGRSRFIFLFATLFIGEAGPASHSPVAHAQGFSRGRSRGRGRYRVNDPRQ